MTSILIAEEENKKIRFKAAGYTAGTLTVLILLFVFISWTHFIAPPEPVQANGGIDVNLGNSDQGWGETPPMVPGDPGPEENAPSETSATPDPTPVAAEEATNKDVVDNNDADAPVIRTAEKPKKATPQQNIQKEKIVADKKTTVTPQQQNTTPQATAKAAMPKQETPKAKALYKGGSGSGGNGADSYNGVSNQGIAGGKGDQGKANGNPNSDSYTGNGGSGGGSGGNGRGSGGVSITDGLNGRRLFSAAFKDKFSQNARVSVSLVVNANGKVVSASINPKGTTTTDANIRSIARRRAMELQFSPGDADKQTGTVQFNFKVSE